MGGTGFAPPPQGYAYQPPPPPQPRPMNDAYVEDGAMKRDFGFDDRSIRAGFIRKVFMIVTVQLAVVAAMVSVAVFHDGTRLFVRQNPALYYVGYGVFLVVYIALMCCESVRRSFPSNVIATGILTIAIGYMTMMISAFYSTNTVFMALVITVVCCASIILFACQTKYDLTSLVGFMFIASMVLMVFGIIAIVAAVAFHTPILYVIYAGFAALLFMVYLAIDVQMIMGGRKYEVSPEDYIFAAIQVFMDIVYIFWMLLTIIGSCNR